MNSIIQSLISFLKNNKFVETADYSNYFTYHIDINHIICVEINPFDTNRFTLYTQIYESLNTEEYSYDTEIIDYQEKIKDKIEHLTKLSIQNNNRFKEKVEFSDKLFTFIEEKGFTEIQNNCYALTLDNKQEIGIFIDCNLNTFSLSYKEELNSHHYKTSRKYYFNSRDYNDFLNTFNRIENSVVFMNGWVTEIDETEINNNVLIKLKKYSYEVKQLYYKLYETMCKEIHNDIRKYIISVNFFKQEDDYIYVIEFDLSNKFMAQYAMDIQTNLKSIFNKYDFIKEVDEINNFDDKQLLDELCLKIEIDDNLLGIHQNMFHEMNSVFIKYI